MFNDSEQFPNITIDAFEHGLSSFKQNNCLLSVILQLPMRILILASFGEYQSGGAKLRK